MRAGVDHFNETGEFDWELLDAELEWVVHPGVWIAGTYRGPERNPKNDEPPCGSVDRFQLDVDRYLDADDAVVALGQTKVHGERSGVTTGRPLAMVFRVRNGQIAAVRSYLRPEDALEAVGLRE